MNGVKTVGYTPKKRVWLIKRLGDLWLTHRMSS